MPVLSPVASTPARRLGRRILATLAKPGRLSPDTLRGDRTLSDAVTKTQHLEATMCEIIALAAAVSVRCDG
jgi:hypothetical protein